jgi:hypothetical protein
MVGLASSAHAQGGPPPPRPGQPGGPPPPPQPALLRVYLDCNFCDSDFLKTEIKFVDYMRDRKDADVHVLVTSEGTGAGGTAWTLKFIGLNTFEGQTHTVTFATERNATDDDQRKEMARILKIGLVAYASGTPAIKSLNVTYTQPTAGTAAAAVKKDPWNYWVFRLSTNGNLSGEASSSNKSFRFNGSASRTTDNWKINISGNRNENRNTYDLGDGELFKSRTSSWGASSTVVKSAGPRLSFGARTNVSGSTYSNQDLAFSFMPGVEFDFFPYKESTRRSLTLTYSAGVVHNNYTEETIFDKLSETLPRHSMGLSLGLRQPWGSISSSVDFSQQLNKLDRTNLGFFGSADVRLFKGFSFNVFGDYSRIRDQISLIKGTASNEDVLLRLRQIQSGYSYYVGFGVSYSFGSIFNSVVNPRYGGSGGGMMFFF